MLCKLITKTDYPTISVKDNRKDVEVQLDSLHINAIPLLDGNKFLGVVSRNILQIRKEENLVDLLAGLAPEWVAEDDHVFRALRLMANQRAPIVAVHSKDGEYVGVVTVEDLIPAVATLLGMEDAPSGSITIEMDRNDYSFGELARLVETNDADIVQLNTYMEKETGLFVINMKISREDVSDVVATLQRYDYHIRYYFGQESYENELKSNYDALINYLNI
ncbi:MAG: hypothetical protein DI598_12290 [Pseudopedobacter saltans]|uniref:CBS domain-containing protein n=1 Tax=Pseudopedobacter saltans TaxID=151895 RepID=A0A2W5GSJ8_9SPHI|nr:MAG: hypothetical protein DI598_12290 [Pseudopedobacter saltans]